MLAFLAGWGILRVIALVPFLGGLAWFGATVFGLGALASRCGGRAADPVTGPRSAGRGVTHAVVTGTIEFVWDTDGHLLVNMEPDDPGDPHTFELTGDAARPLAGKVAEGSRVEVEFEPVPYEVIDPDSGPSESLRAEVRDVRVLRRRLPPPPASRPR